MKPTDRSGMLADRQAAESSEVVAHRVTAARERATYRLRGTPWQVNAEVSRAELRQCFAPERGALRPLERAIELGEVNTRSTDKVVRIAWSLADLAARSRPEADDMQIAVN